MRCLWSAALFALAPWLLLKPCSSYTGSWHVLGPRQMRSRTPKWDVCENWAKKRTTTSFPSICSSSSSLGPPKDCAESVGSSCSFEERIELHRTSWSGWAEMSFVPRPARYLVCSWRLLLHLGRRLRRLKEFGMRRELRLSRLEQFSARAQRQLIFDAWGNFVQVQRSQFLQRLHENYEATLHSAFQVPRAGAMTLLRVAWRQWKAWRHKRRLRIRQRELAVIARAQQSFLQAWREWHGLCTGVQRPRPEWLQRHQCHLQATLANCLTHLAKRLLREVLAAWFAFSRRQNGLACARVPSHLVTKLLGARDVWQWRAWLRAWRFLVAKEQAFDAMLGTVLASPQSQPKESNFAVVSSRN